MKTTLLTILFLLPLTLLKAGDDYKWPEYIPMSIPDQYKNIDAVYLENSRTIDFHQMNQTSEIYFKRIKILSKKGMETFSKRELYQFNDGIITLKQARVIKPSGEIVELEKEHIIETLQEEKYSYGTSYFKRIQFIFPNLEVGDVIDVVYQMRYDHYLLSQTIYMESDLPALNARLTLRNMSMLELNVFPMQNMTDFISRSSDDIPTFAWHKTNVEQQTESFFSAPAPNSSKVSYNLWYRGEILTYDNYYEFDLMQYRESKGIIGFNKLLQKEGLLQDEQTPLNKLIRLIWHIEQHFEWISEAETSATVKTTDYFSRKVVNKTLFFRYMQAFMDENKIDYNIGFTQDLDDGKFEPGYVSFSQLQHRFLEIKDLEGNAHYLFSPSSPNSFYYMDEIPFYAEGNNGIILNGDKINLTNAFNTVIPVSDQLSNKHTANILLKVNSLVTDSIAFKRSDLFTGHYSVLFRGDNRASSLRHFAVAEELVPPVDSLLYYPYDLNFKQEGHYKELINEIEDTLFWFKPELLLPSGIYFEDEQNEEITEFGILPFIKSDKFSVYLESSTPINLRETTKTLVYNNEIGLVKAEAIQINDHTIKFIYEIKLTKRILENKIQNEALQQLLQGWFNIRTKKWAVSQ